MDIGIPREIKDGEPRVGATPEAVRALALRGHAVVVESGAGARIGFDDGAYARAGARIVGRPDDAFACALVVKVKELQPPEYRLARAGTVICSYQQLGRDPRLLAAALASGASFLAYEAVLDADGRRPLLSPMSTLAGLLSPQIAAWALQARPGPLSGSGVLLFPLEGVTRASVVVVGEGVAGGTAAGAFLDIGCGVTVLGKQESALHALAERLGSRGRGRLRVACALPSELAPATAEADVVVGAVSVPGRLAPKLITRPMLRAMRPGSVLIDIGIDMGGIAETSRQTKHSDPIYVEEGVLHYCVPNIPALVPRTASEALVAATLPYLQRLAGDGLGPAVASDPGLLEGLQVHRGHIVHRGLAADTGSPFVPYQEADARRG